MYGLFIFVTVVSVFKTHYFFHYIFSLERSGNEGYNRYCKDLWEDLCSKNDISSDEDDFCDFVGSEKCDGTSSNLRGSDAITE